MEVGDLTIFDRLYALEKRVASLEARVRAVQTAPPMDRGATFFPSGDSIPSRGSPAEFQVEKIFIVDGVPLAFVKNNSGRSLKRGEDYSGGKVDTKLRADSVESNNFFYLEI